MSSLTDKIKSVFGGGDHSAETQAGEGSTHTTAGTTTSSSQHPASHDSSNLNSGSHGRSDTSGVPGAGVATGPGTAGGVHASELTSARTGTKTDDFTSGLEGTKAGHTGQVNSGLTGSQHGSSGLPGSQHGTSGSTGNEYGSAGNQYGTSGTNQMQSGSHSGTGAGRLAGHDRDSRISSHDEAFSLGTGSRDSTSNTTRDTASNPLSSGTSSNLKEGDNSHRDRHLGEGAAGAVAGAAAGQGASKLSHHDSSSPQHGGERGSSSSANPATSHATTGGANTSGTTGTGEKGGAGAMGGITATPQEQTIAGGKDPKVVAASQPTTHNSGSMLDIGDVPISSGRHHTAGPHKSDTLNKADPRVDSDRDGSRVHGGEKSTSHTGRDTAGLAGAGAGAGAAYAAHEHNKHGNEPHHNTGTDSSSAQPTGSGIDPTHSDTRSRETGHSSGSHNTAGLAGAGAGAGAAYAAHEHNKHDRDSEYAGRTGSGVDPMHSDSRSRETGLSTGEHRDNSRTGAGVGAGAAGIGAGAAYAAHEHKKHERDSERPIGSGVDPTHSDTRATGHTGGILKHHNDQPTSTTGHSHQTTTEDYNDPSGHHHDNKLLGFLHHNKDDKLAGHDARGSSLPSSTHGAGSDYDNTRSGHEDHTGRNAALAGAGAAGAGYGASRLGKHHNEPSVGQHGTTPSDAYGASSVSPRTGTHDTSGLGTATGNYGSAEGTHGPHSSRIANAADPRIDSDRDGRGGIGSTTHTSGLTPSQGTSGLGSSYDNSGLPEQARGQDGSHTGRNLAGAGAAAGAGYGASHLGHHGNDQTPHSHGTATHGDYNTLGSGTPSGVSYDDQRATAPHASNIGGNFGTTGYKDSSNHGLGSGSGSGSGVLRAPTDAVANELRSKGSVTHNCRECGEANDISKYFTK
ncbi:putative DUF3824 domain-containing protein [Seiridium cardinale]